MTYNLKWKALSTRALKGICCPYCKRPLIKAIDHMTCTNEECKRVFPQKKGIPILINEDNSLFPINDFLTYSDSVNEGYLQTPKWERVLPGISLNLSSARNFDHFANLLCQQNPNPLVLVIGGRITGKGMEVLNKYPDIEVVSSDVAFGSSTQLIADAHDIPFIDQFFDGVIAQAVLEHVIDPVRCVSELHRVLKSSGLVYAETPFMQQVHEGRYDFTRFTHLGHRRLFRWFTEIDSGPTGGPGMALAWSIRYFLLSFTKGKRSRKWIGGLARFIAFFWKYFDPRLAETPGGYDAASGYYFLGAKSEVPVSDRAIIQQYRGAID